MQTDLLPKPPAVETGNRLTTSPIQPITVPLWLGAECPGVEQGAALLDAGLRRRWCARQEEALTRRLAPAVAIPVADPPDALDRLHRQTLEFLEPVAAAADATAAAVAAAIGMGDLAVVLGGDHALAAGSIAGAALATDRLGVLWLDTHADLNTPATSPSGHLHGMALAATLGFGPPRLTAIGGPGPALDPSDLCLLGVRDLDPGERALIRDQGIWLLTMEEWTDAGLLPGLDAALTHLSGRGVDAIHLSLDLDVLDPSEMPGTGTSVAGGLSYRELSRVLRWLRDWPGPIHSLDLVELNPLLDPSGRSTATAVLLLATLLGETMR